VENFFDFFSMKSAVENIFKYFLFKIIEDNKFYPRCPDLGDFSFFSLFWGGDNGHFTPPLE
jgi:hypothetical protein